MRDGVVAGSFRDPSGFLFTREGVLYRQVNQAYRDDFEYLESSGLYAELVDEGLLVPHEETDETPPEPGRAFKVIRPRRLPFISYPYEWCFGQLKSAALATLDIQERALDRGMSLRDASSYNLQFDGGKPVLIDTLSFERLQEGAPWVAYRQFCQHFLAPLALMAECDVRLSQLLRSNIDGVPLDLTSGLLPARTKLKGPLLLHLHSHAKSQKRSGDKGVSRDDVKGRFSIKAFRGLIESLRSGVRNLTWAPQASAWIDYYAEGDSYEAEALSHKQELVRRHLKARSPGTVWDLGANTGMFSRIAADEGSFAIAFEMDPSSVERNYRQVVAGQETRLLPLVMDLADPSPSLGWAGEERMSLADRGPVDMALALAVVHHLAIGNNVPLPRIADYLARLAKELVIEFVPKSDPKVEVLLSSREDVFDDYHAEGFEAAFARVFAIEAKDRVMQSERTLYLMSRRSDPGSP